MGGFSHGCWLAPVALCAATAVAGAPGTMPNGRRLREGAACFTMLRGGVPFGRTLQTVRAVRMDGRAAWDVVVHQRQDSGGFDMRDHFVVDRTTLRPLSMESAMGRDRGFDGWHRVAVRYLADRIVGTKETAGGETRIDVPLEGPVWDGNLWGLVFASLPLRDGGRYALPFWQYDKGFGAFAVTVVGRERVETPAGVVDAWRLSAGDDPARPARWDVAVGRPSELGYSAGPFAQRLGGDCSDLVRGEAASAGRGAR